MFPIVTEIRPEDQFIYRVGRNRRFTQTVASYFFECIDDVRDAPAYDGLFFRSRYDPAWECWAVFERALEQISAVTVQEIEAHDPDLYNAAALLNLTIQTPHGELVRPKRT